MPCVPVLKVRLHDITAPASTILFTVDSAMSPAMRSLISWWSMASDESLQREMVAGRYNTSWLVMEVLLSNRVSFRIAPGVSVVGGET